MLSAHLKEMSENNNTSEVDKEKILTPKCFQNICQMKTRFFFFSNLPS